MRNIPSIRERMQKFWALYIVPLFMLAGAGGNSGGRLENQCCVGGGSNSWEGAGTNGDWLRFFWDRYTNVSDTCADWPMKLDMLKLYQQTRLNVIEADPIRNGVIYVGSDLGLYRSKNKGLTFQRWGYGLPLVSVTDIWIAADGSMYRAGTYGRGVWQLAGFGFNNP